MKWMIASDIHGSAPCCAKMLQRFNEEHADRLILLGDLLYHGPRNDLPEGYAPKEVIRMLNEYADRLLCVRGNCEAEVDQMVLSFPVMADYAILAVGRHLIYLTHGHHANASYPPPLSGGDILLHGHTHVPICEEHEHFTCLNPGSVSLPKDGSCRSYMIFENSVFLWKALEDGAVWKEYVWRPDIFRLYHAGYDVIKTPDLGAGRINADFGQGFYLTDNKEFAGKWMRERKDSPIVINEYELDMADLAVYRFVRGEDWYDYIFRNRAGGADVYAGAGSSADADSPAGGAKSFAGTGNSAGADSPAGGANSFAGADVLIGPVANDTIYDTLGIFTSGFLSREESIRLMMLGPAFDQIVLKTPKAVAALRWISCRTPDHEEAQHFRKQVAEEEAAYQKMIAEALAGDEG